MCFWFLGPSLPNFDSSWRLFVRVAYSVLSIFIPPVQYKLPVLLPLVHVVGHFVADVFGACGCYKQHDIDEQPHAQGKYLYLYLLLFSRSLTLHEAFPARMCFFYERICEKKKEKKVDGAKKRYCTPFEFSEATAVRHPPTPTN